MKEDISSKLTEDIAVTKNDVTKTTKDDKNNAIKQTPEKVKRHRNSAEQKAKFIEKARQIPDDLETLQKEFGYSSTLTVYQALSNAGIYTGSKIEKLLNKKTDEQIAKEGNVTVEAVARIREKNNKKQSSINRRKIIEMAKNGVRVVEIKKALNYGTSNEIYNILKSEGIFTRREIIALLPQRTDEEIAEMGKVTVEAVARIRKEKIGNVQDFKSRAAQIPDDLDTLAKEFGYSRFSIYSVLRRYKIYNKSQIIEAIQKRRIENPDEADIEIAKEGNIEVETVKRIREEYEEAGQKNQTRIETNKVNAKIEKERKRAKLRDEQEARLERAKKEREKKVQQLREREELVIQLGKNLILPSSISMSVGYSIEKVYRILKENGIYGRAKVINLLESKTNQEIAEEGNLNIKAVEQVRQEEADKVLMRKMSKQKEHTKTKQTTYVKREKVTSEQQDDTYGQLDKESTQSVQSTEQEKVATKKIDFQSRKKMMEDKENLIFRGIKNIEDPRKIARETQTSVKYVYEVLKKYHFYSREQVVSFLSSLTDEQIAQRGSVNVEAVGRVRKQEEEKIRRKNSSEMQEETLKKQRLNERLKIDENVLFFKLARGFEPIEKISSIMELNPYEIRFLLKRLKIYTREDLERLIETSPKLTNQQIAEIANGEISAVEKIRNQINIRNGIIKKVPNNIRKNIEIMLDSSKTVEYISYKTKRPTSEIKAIRDKRIRDKQRNITEERKKVNLKIEINELRNLLKNVEYASKNSQDVLFLKINKILTQYDTILSQTEYAFLAYSCMKIGKYLQAIHIGEMFLNLRDTSIEGIIGRIEEIQNSNEKKKEMCGTTR